MNSSAIHELIDSIRTLLDGHPTSMAAEIVAQEYAKQCQEVNDRLARISPMLSEGGQIQALQLAEQNPRVLDVAIILSFGGETAWQEYCRDHGYRVPPLIDARTIAALQDVEAKGVSSNHPLYKDYRSAVSARDDDKAYQLIKIITRLNPSDENAAKEISRLERKTLQVALVELRKALQSKNIEALLEVIPKIEQTSTAESYQNLPEWLEAITLRNQYRKQDAHLRMPMLLIDAENAMEAGTWRLAATFVTELSVLSHAYGWNNVNEEIEERIQAITTQVAWHRSESERVDQTQQWINEMNQLVDEIEAREARPSGLTLDFVAPTLETLIQHWQHNEESNGEISEKARMRIIAARSHLHQWMERHRKSRHQRKQLVMMAAILTVIVSGTVGFFAIRASGHAKALSVFQEKNTASAVSDLLKRINNQESWLISFSSLSRAMAEAEQWLKTAKNKTELIEHEIKKLEIARENNFDEIGSVDLHSRLSETRNLLDQLPSDLCSVAAGRLSILENDGGRVLLKRQGASDQEALKAIEQWTLVLDQISIQSSADHVAELLQDSESTLRPFLEMNGQTEERLRLYPNTKTALQGLDTRLKDLREQIQKVRDWVAALNSASTLSNYWDTLQRLSESNFLEGISAQQIRRVWPENPDEIRAFLLFRGDLAALQAAANDQSSDLPLPKEVRKSDRELISELISNSTLNGLWEVVWKRKNGPIEKCLSQKELEKTSSHSWYGKVASYPQHPSSDIKYIETRFGKADDVTIITNRIAPVSALMFQLRLPNLFNDSGSEFRFSLLPLIDQVTRAKDASPLARAYILSRFFKIIKGQEDAWGLYYYPELINDIAAFQELEQQWPLLDQSWLIEKKTSYFQPWIDYFAERETRPFYNKLKQMKSAASYGIANPLQLVGRVATNGELKFEKSEKSRLLLAIGEDQKEKPQLCFAGVLEANAEIFTPKFHLLPLSPVVSVDMPQKDQIFLQQIHALHSVTPANASTP